jgi:hypothetical protein
MAAMDTPNERTANRNQILSVTLTVAAAVIGLIWRLIPHIPNTTPVGAMGLFSGARLRWWQAALLMLAVMAVSDAILWQWFNYDPFSPWVYGSFLVNVLIGAWLSRRGDLWCVGLGSVLASVQFFLVTNFGTWFSQTLYPHTLTGLLDCYIAGLPFFGYTLAGDLSCSALLFGTYALIAHRTMPAAEAHHEVAAAGLAGSRER